MIAAVVYDLWTILLTIVAIVLFFSGLFRLFAGQILMGTLLIVASFLVGPGGISILS